ncbi:MAG: N-carbamoyl-D-amino-acid hydrolase [Pseudomonadota bacterium]
MRELVLAAAQMGPIQRADARETVVARMLDLLSRAKAAGADLVVFPELCLTTFFPRWMLEGAELDAFYEREMPNAATQPLFDAAREAGVAISIGYAELTPEGQRFNTQILTDKTGAIVGVYRKVHLPGHSEHDPDRAFQHLEKRYFLPGDLGFPVWRSQGAVMGMLICNDRRWAEAWRVLGLQGVELVMLGYNTPSVNSQAAAEGPEMRLYHHELSMTAGAYQNATWAVAVAKAGVEDGHPLIGGSVIVDPDGRVVARTTSEADELIVHACDMDACAFGKTTIFDFARHRRPEHYGRITAQIGAEPPEA